MGGLLKCLTDCAPTVDDKLILRGSAYIAALGVWGVIGLVAWLVT